MPDEVILDVTTIEENVTVETTAGDVVEIQVVAPTGPAGATGPAGPNSVTSATTSDYTAELNLAQVNTGVLVVTDGVTIETLDYNFGTGSAQALKDALEIASADITDATSNGNLDKEKILKTDDQGGLFVTNSFGINASFGTSLTVGDGDSVNGRYDIFANTSHFQWYSASALYGEREFTITTENLTSSGSYVYKYPVGSGTFALTANTSGEPDKLTDGTIAGTLTLNSTSYTYGTGAAAAHRNALGVVSNSELLSSVYEWSKSTADYSATNVGTGTSSTSTNVMQFNTLATAGSSALLRSDASDFRAWQKYSGSRQAVDWSKKTMHYVRISSDAFSGADTIFRIYLGLPATLTTVQDLQSANTAIGFKVVNGVIFVQVSNGSAVTTTTTGVTMSAWLVYDCMIQSNGDGTWTATVNSTTVTGSGAPTTTSAASNAALIMSATNGTTASARRFFINIQRSMQHD
jgi:hypothetical protein